MARHAIVCLVFVILTTNALSSNALDDIQETRQPIFRAEDTAPRPDSFFLLRDQRVFCDNDPSWLPAIASAGFEADASQPRGATVCNRPESPTSDEPSVFPTILSDKKVCLVSATNCTEAADMVGVQGPTCWRPLDTLTLFGGLEGSKQPQDFGVNADFGGRWAANWGFPLLADYGIGAQIGTSINYTDNAVAVFQRLGATSQRTQNFSTVGVFQRTEHWRWGLGYDFLYESYFDQFLLAQWRGRGGYAPTDRDEFGIWFTIPQQRDNGSFLAVPVQLSPLAQGSVYWQHQFSAGTRVMGWAGVAQGHSQANYALGDDPRTGSRFVFGAEIDVPLNRYFSIYGQANFISPADTGTVDSFLGVTYYPGGRAFPVTRSLFAAYQALANSPMFAVDMRRR